MFTSIATLLFNTLDNIATPCSVNAMERYLVPPQVEAPIWLLKISNSFLVNPKMKSFGNRSIFLLTCLFSCFVSTFYNPDRSKSSITFFPLIRYILLRMASSETAIDFSALVIDLNDYSTSIQSSSRSSLPLPQS